MIHTLTKRPTPIPPAIPRPVPKPAMTMAEYAKIESAMLKMTHREIRDKPREDPRTVRSRENIIKAIRQNGGEGTCQEIASITGSAQDATRRHLVRWEREGWLSVDSRVVNNPPRRLHFYSLTGKGEAV